MGDVFGPGMPADERLCKSVLAGIPQSDRIYDVLATPVGRVRHRVSHQDPSWMICLVLLLFKSSFVCVEHPGPSDSTVSKV